MRSMSLALREINRFPHDAGCRQDFRKVSIVVNFEGAISDSNTGTVGSSPIFRRAGGFVSEGRAVQVSHRTRRLILAVGGMVILLALGVAASSIFSAKAEAGPPWKLWRQKPGCDSVPGGDGPPMVESGGTWYWSRSPEDEKRVIIGHYNRYCIRCHGVDGRGVWDIPDVPDFTNPRWQASRTDTQLVRLTLEGRGAVMPPFRGSLTLEEGWAMARYIRSFVPGTETPRPNLNLPKKTEVAPK